VADPVELAGYIRYSIDNLGAHNAHHRFEEMCFHLAKVIVTPDLVFPTGPVSAGGDQGRDFETFRGRLGDEDLAFACTVQKDDLPAKLRADVKKAATEGEPLDAVVFMCAGNIPIAKRHELQAEVRKEYKVRLEVFDAETIADKLAEYANFWIARRYLEIPESMAPDTPEGPEWYAASKRRWLGRNDPPATYGELTDVQECGRHVVFGDGPKADLEFWLERLRSLAEPAGGYLERSAFYQVVVLTLRGTNLLLGFDDDLARYFEHIPELDGEVEVEDTEVLLTYVSTASLTGKTTLSTASLRRWREALIAQIEYLLGSTNSSSRRCALLLSLACTHLVAVDPDEPYPPAARDAAMKAWAELVAESDDAPYYPIGRVGRVVGGMLPLFVDHPTFDELMSGIDKRVGGRSNPDLVVAWRDRGVVLFKNGRPLEALDFLHQARRAWFAKDTIRGSILTGLTIAQCYGELGLMMAGKLMALSAANSAINEFGPDVTDLISKSVFLASRFDYALGYWMGAVELTRAAILLYDELDTAPWKSEDDRRDQHFLQLFAPYGVAKALRPTAVPAIERALKDAGLFEQVSNQDGPWRDLSEREVIAAIAEQASATAFADCGELRTLETHLGNVRWSVSCDNTFEAALGAERFVATAEVLGAIAATEEPKPAPHELNLELRVEGSVMQAKRIVDGDRELWNVILPSGGSAGSDFDDVITMTLGAAITVLRSTYPVSAEELDRLSKRLAERCASVLLSLGGTYDSLAARITPKDLWNQQARRSSSPLR
jgi:hypothetical protein